MTMAMAIEHTPHQIATGCGKNHTPSPSPKSRASAWLARMVETEIQEW